VDGDLDVMPWWTKPVGGAQRAGLFVAAVRVIVPAAMAQVDSAHIGHVLFGAVGVAQHDQLLMMRSAGAHPRVEQAFTARGHDRFAQVAVFLQAVPEPVQV
jgi:hypothetical protein